MAVDFRVIGSSTGTKLTFLRQGSDETLKCQDLLVPGFFLVARHVTTLRQGDHGIERSGSLQLCWEAHKRSDLLIAYVAGIPDGCRVYNMLPAGTVDEALGSVGLKAAAGGDMIAVWSVASYVPRYRVLEMTSNFLPPDSVHDVSPGPTASFPNGWLGLHPYPVPANFLSCAALTIDVVEAPVGGECQQQYEVRPGMTCQVFGGGARRGLRRRSKTRLEADAFVCARRLHNVGRGATIGEGFWLHHGWRHVEGRRRSVARVPPVHPLCGMRCQVLLSV